MTQLTIKVKGELVRKGLQDLSAELPKIGRQQIRTLMERVKRKMQEYPPEPSHRTKTAQHGILGLIYTKTGRTGRLGSSWKIEPADNGYRLDNVAPYAIYVHGDAYGGIHNSHPSFKPWNKTRNVMDEEIEKLPREIEDEIVIVARRNGL